jgi:hydrogenase maturation protease
MEPVAAVIGVGNRFRHDEGVGPAVIDRLRGMGLDNVTLAESDGEAGALIMLWDRQRLAILIDAMQADPSHPGRVHRLVVPKPAVERLRAVGALATDVGDSAEIARMSGRLPGTLIVFGIETGDVAAGSGLSPAVDAAVERVAEEIAAEIRAQRRSLEPAA